MYGVCSKDTYMDNVSPFLTSDHGPHSIASNVQFILLILLSTTILPNEYSQRWCTGRISTFGLAAPIFCRLYLLYHTEMYVAHE